MNEQAMDVAWQVLGTLDMAWQDQTKEDQTSQDQARHDQMRAWQPQVVEQLARRTPQNRQLTHQVVTLQVMRQDARQARLAWKSPVAAWVLQNP